MVDVQPGVPAAALDEPVDEPLEDRPLAVAVARPERLVAHLAGVVAVAVAEEELEPARGLVERVPLEVEPDVAGVGRGQEPEAALLLVVEELVEVRARDAAAELELGLVAHLLEALGPQAVRAAVAVRRERAELRERVDPVGEQPLGPAAAHPGDEHEVVVGLEPRAAEVPEVADPAVPARPGVGRVLARERGEEPLPHAPVVRLELGGAEALALAAPVLDVDVLDRRALQPLDLLGVEEELEQVRRLGRARELRVDGLVGAVGQALEEVGEPAPAPVGADEVRLVDDLGGARADRLLGEPAGDVGRRSPRPRSRACGRSSARRPRAARGRQPRARRPCGGSGRRACRPRAAARAPRGRPRASGSSGAGRRGGSSSSSGVRSVTIVRPSDSSRAR